ncbi:MAG: hypothetical protein ACLSUM_12585 [Dysosmobacter welbionis]
MTVIGEEDAEKLLRGQSPWMRLQAHAHRHRPGGAPSRTWA